MDAQLSLFHRVWLGRVAWRRRLHRAETHRIAIISANVGQLVAIGTYGTRDEAEVVQGLLASAGIEASITADDAGGAFPFVLSGGAQVLVDESDATAAAELLANRTDAT
jgi:type III secretory pathway lipoprotein EscJ